MVGVDYAATLLAPCCKVPVRHRHGARQANGRVGGFGQDGSAAGHLLLAVAHADSAADEKWWQLDRHINQLGGTIDQTVEHAIRLIVVFLLQILILPLAVFWILLCSGRMLTAPGAGT